MEAFEELEANQLPLPGRAATVHPFVVSLLFCCCFLFFVCILSDKRTRERRGRWHWIDAAWESDYNCHHNGQGQEMSNGQKLFTISIYRWVNPAEQEVGDIEWNLLEALSRRSGSKPNNNNGNKRKMFLVACTRLYDPLCPLVGQSVRHA